MNHKKLLSQMVVPMLTMLLLLACVTLQPTLTSRLIPPTVTSNPILPTYIPSEAPFASPTITMESAQRTVPSYRAQIKISTTSDWTTFRLVTGGTWYGLKLVSASEQALSAEFDGDRFSLSQSIDRAEAGESVELIADAFFTDIDPKNPLKFEIERGHIGSTRVSILNYQDGTPKEIAVLNWEGISAGERNTQVYKVFLDTFLGTKPNEYIVIAQLNFWYYGPGQYGGFENPDGSRVTPLTPLLGETYWAKDPSVVYQQIEWAVEYGVDAFSIEWTTPRGIGCCGSMEDTLDDVFLKSPNIRKVRWAIFYDFPLRLMQTEELDVDMENGINFDQPDVYNTFVYDLARFAEKYFGNPQYLTIDERPVIYVWASNNFKGNLAGAMQEARQRVSELGYDVFIVGEEVCYQCFDRQHVALFDASTAFTMFIPGLDIYALDDVGEAAVEVDRAFQWWRKQIAGLKVVGREELVNFQPGWAPQYDERYFITDRPKYVPAQSKEQVIEMAMVARNNAEPAGSSGLKLIWLNTWNNWAETTTVEPTVNLGPKYPAGNYQFDMLEVIREIFGSETF